MIYDYCILLKAVSVLQICHFFYYFDGLEFGKLVNEMIFNRVFLLCQIWIVKYSVKYSTVECKYLLFLQDFFFRSKPKQYKKCQYS